MEPTFRASMNWLHTWAGVTLGSLLFAIFWMGTLSVFDREIDLWMKSSTRLMPASLSSIDAIHHELGPPETSVEQWYMLFPTERDPVLRIIYREPGGPFVSRAANSATMKWLPDPGTWAGTRFIFRFHFGLHLSLWSIGYWIVGLAGMAMMALCVSGVIIRRRIFTDFFRLDPERKPRRLLLNLHTTMGVLGLPFHLMISLSGLIIFFAVYFPSTRDLAYRADREAFNREAFCSFSRPRIGVPGAMPVSLDDLLIESLQMWDGGKPFLLRIWHPGDANSYVEVRRSFEDSVTMATNVAYFDAATGALLQSSTTAPVMTAQRFISGLHFIQFRHWTLRWLYFVLGLAGCVLIATGYLFWLESRRKKHERLGLGSVRVVEGLTIGSVTGIIIATLAFFVVNRLLPLGFTFARYDRAALEIWSFYLAWLATFVHAWSRWRNGWVEQCWAIAALAVSAVILNWITTGDHVVRSLAHRHLWPIAGMDILLLIAAGSAVATALRLRRKPNDSALCKV